MQIPTVALCLTAALARMCPLSWGGAAEAPAEVLFAPGAAGYVTSWLVAGPFGFLRDSQLDQDFLGGEATVRPRDGDVVGGVSPRRDPRDGDVPPTVPEKRVAWQAVAFADPVLNFKERCLPLGRSAFYLAAAVVAKKDVDLALVLTHTGQARAWLDGKEVVRSDKDAYSLGPKTVEHAFALKAGQRTQWLLKLGSDGRYLQILVRLKSGPRAAQADEVAIALPLAAGAKPNPEAFLLPSLSLGLPRQRFVEPGEKANLAFGFEGSYPLCEGQVAAAIAVADAKGQTAGKLEVPATKLPELALAPAEVAWTPPKEGGSPFFTLTAQVTLDGRSLGTVARKVYAPANIGHWTGDLHKRLLALASAKKLASDDLACVLLKIEKAAMLQQGGDVRAFAPDTVTEQLDTASDWLARLEAGQGLPPLEPGVHELAYLAPQDDSAQPYYLHVPPAARDAKPLPAIVYLHGYAPWLDKTNWYEVSAGLTAQADARGYAVIVPFARSNTDFQSIGEWDVMHVLGLAEKRLKLDPDRVFLIGYSMGGAGVYTLAAHYPDRWAGGIVMCGRPRNYLWKDLDPARVEPFKRHLLDLESGAPHAHNYTYLPFLVFQGTADVLIQPEQAYRFVEDLTHLGLKAQLVKLEGQSHWIADEVFSTPQVFDWMDARRREPAPRNVRFKTHSLLYDRAWWLTLDAFERWGEPAEANATLEPGNKLELATRNVAALTLRPPKELADPKAPLAAKVNGKEAQLVPDAEGRFVVELSPRPEGPLRKKPTLCGPIKDAFNRRFLFVVGTAGDQEATERNRTLARQMQKEWYAFAKGIRQIASDTAITDAEMARSNLLLFGTPKTNAVLARLADRLPIRFTDEGYEILGKTYKAGETTGLMFIYPNPLAPERYIVVCDGQRYGEKLGENHKYDLLPDFIIYSAEPDYDDTNCFYVAGFFDGAWKLDPKLAWTSDGRPKPRPTLAPPARPDGF
ncbi:MAG TPA: prolyl oligopeptidase family serine peptidase [Planctomycetota bacterium]|nr:prolyl oligopeptidase family serine peptidase [Planctomycetota bacterium]HRT94684.1 prolyl oligopeptidase family serine peptidase [Planctomycetota bacterium]